MGSRISAPNLAPAALADVTLLREPYRASGEVFGCYRWLRKQLVPIMWGCDQVLYHVDGTIQYCKESKDPSATFNNRLRAMSEEGDQSACTVSVTAVGSYSCVQAHPRQCFRRRLAGPVVIKVCTCTAALTTSVTANL
jgi:hypothetical protein